MLHLCKSVFLIHCFFILKLEPISFYVFKITNVSLIWRYNVFLSKSLLNLNLNTEFSKFVTFANNKNLKIQVKIKQKS